LHVDVLVSNFVFDFVAGRLNIVTNVRGDILSGVSDVSGRIVRDIAVVSDGSGAVIVVLAHLAGAEQQQRNGDLKAHWDLLFESQRRLRCFGSGSIPPDNIAS